MDFPASVQYLYSLGNEVKTIKLGLDRIRRLLEELGNPQYACPVVHVAGTNGKGSVCAMIESGLREAGYKTGFFTSPHLVSPTERIRINNEPVSEADFSRAFDEIHKVSERLLAAGELDCHPTYFETVTAMGFWLFREAKVESLVLEVGLGGRLDATNVVDPILSVITPVDLDHQQYLGDTLEEIAVEKAGIIKPGRPVVLGLQHPQIKHLFVADELEDVATWRISDLQLRVDGCHYRAERAGVVLEVDCPLAGAHQVGNSLAAAVSLWLLGIEPPVVKAGIAKATWPGRLELIRRNPLIYLDGAHNPSAARRLRQFIDRHFSGREIWMVFGVMRDKEVTEIAGELFPVASRLILTRANQQRSLETESIRDLFPHPNSQVCEHVSEAIAMLDQAPADAVIFITGSLFVVGEARPLLQ
ncbi:MAG: bifunctional folylpolyglutamate synthase/dihydrofolate synthase [Acidobacteria bacterium]|nr:bifunctional folylpolyglutamate synthase/dihydrofolate synthase [Acidobacteriota bacterium]